MEDYKSLSQQTHGDTYFITYQNFIKQNKL